MTAALNCRVRSTGRTTGYSPLIGLDGVGSSVREIVSAVRWYDPWGAREMEDPGGECRGSEDRQETTSTGEMSGRVRSAHAMGMCVRCKGCRSWVDSALLLLLIAVWEQRNDGQVIAVRAKGKR